MPGVSRSRRCRHHSNIECNLDARIRRNFPPAAAIIAAAILFTIATSTAARVSRRPEVEAVPPHQRLVAGEVSSLSSNGMLPVASSSKSWIAPSRAPSKGRVRDSNVRDAD